MTLLPIVALMEAAHWKAALVAAESVFVKEAAQRWRTQQLTLMVHVCQPSNVVGFQLYRGTTALVVI